MKTIITFLIFLLILLYSPVIGKTAPITFLFEYGSADISVDATTYDNVYLKIVATADTTNVTNPYSGTYFVDYDSLELTIGGLGIGSFTDSGYVFIAGQTVGFGNNNVYDFAYIAGLPISGYDLMSSIGPLTGLAAEPTQWVKVPTTLGLTTLIGFDSPVDGGTFTATTVPEPATMLLLGSGLLGLVGLRRKFSK
jgi:hypothetical protein